MRYGTIDALNRRWSTQYWSQRYQRFDQVPPTVGRDQNPALVRDARRFFSTLGANYVDVQAVAIWARGNRRQFVTINSTARQANEWRVLGSRRSFSNDRLWAGC